MSPPCQPYTRVGLQLGSKDRRTDSFFFILKLIGQLKNPPSYILVENVKGFEESDTHEITINTLKECNYEIQEFLLTPSQFGIPNSRMRYYLLAKRKPLKFSFETQPSPIFFIPKSPYFDVQGHSTVPLRPVSEFLEPNSKIEDLLVPDGILWKWGNVFDIVTTEALNTCCFTKGE
jgi:tRNA (cytosine38-C5)-methyltransferase